MATAINLTIPDADLQKSGLAQLLFGENQIYDPSTRVTRYYVTPNQADQLEKLVYYGFHCLRGSGAVIDKRGTSMQYETALARIEAGDYKVEDFLKRVDNV